MYTFVLFDWKLISSYFLHFDSIFLKSIRKLIFYLNFYQFMSLLTNKIQESTKELKQEIEIISFPSLSFP